MNPNTYKGWKTSLKSVSCTIDRDDKTAGSTLIFKDKFRLIFEFWFEILFKNYNRSSKSL